ncbi:MAG: hypothetical protein Q4D51_03870 [Eubacteriales bacterium]|nr:hypothetical protein [Eubacteriales bacterium]
MNKKIDEMLYRSLKPDQEPSEALNRRILQEWSKEEQKMSHFNYKKKVAAIAVVSAMALGGVTTYAAYHFMKPAQVAQVVTENDALVKAFESEDAILIDETQSSNGYNITMLGLVSGDHLKLYVPEKTKDEVNESHTYVAVAISKRDGSAMENKNFCVSPLIHGESIMDVNAATMMETMMWFEQNGIVYELIECDNLEIFADRGVQLGVVENFGDETSAFEMNEKNGVYEKSGRYKGTSALFTLPFDVAKADPEKAKKYLVGLSQKDDEEMVETQVQGEEQPFVSVDVGEHDEKEVDALYEKAKAFVDTVTAENIDEYFDADPQRVVTATPDAEGWVDFGTVIVDGDTWDCGRAKEEVWLPEGVDFNIYSIALGIGENALDLSGLQICVIEKNKDGSLTQTTYRAKPDLSAKVKL